MITEYCEGGSLSTVIKKTKDMSILTKVDLMLQVCSAMTYLHSCEPSIVHRDLKPGNVLLDKTRTVAKVCDFGMARAHTNTIVTTRHPFSGTVSYMAPECLREEEITNKVDVYSFGVLFVSFSV